MGETSLVRTVRFNARHRYWRDEWTAERNRRVFGAQVEPHEHDWAVEVTVHGPVADGTGWVVDLVALDERLQELVGPLDRQDLNEVIPEVREGGMMPTTENLARWFWQRLAGGVPGDARLVRVRVEESDTLAAEYRA